MINLTTNGTPESDYGVSLLLIRPIPGDELREWLSTQAVNLVEIRKAYREFDLNALGEEPRKLTLHLGDYDLVFADDMDVIRFKLRWL